MSIFRGLCLDFNQFAILLQDLTDTYFREHLSMALSFL